MVNWESHTLDLETGQKKIQKSNKLVLVTIQQTLLLLVILSTTSLTLGLVPGPAPHQTLQLCPASLFHIPEELRAQQENLPSCHSKQHDLISGAILLHGGLL